MPRVVNNNVVKIYFNFNGSAPDPLTISYLLNNAYYTCYHPSSGTADYPVTMSGTSDYSTTMSGTNSSTTN